MTPAILLAAGYGTRMGALGAVPKALLPVGGRPVVDHLLDLLAALPGLDGVHLVTNRRHHHAFVEWLPARSAALPWPLVVHDDGTASPEERLGAVGDLAFALERVGAVDGALVAACDNLFRFSLRPLWDAFRAGGGSRVLALREDDVERLRRTGVLELAADGRVVALHEKPAAPPSSWACPPLYGLDGAALARVGPYLEAGQPRDEIGRFVAFLATHEPVWATVAEGERLDVGSPEAWRRAQELLGGPVAQ